MAKAYRNTKLRFQAYFDYHQKYKGARQEFPLEVFYKIWTKLRFVTSRGYSIVRLNGQFGRTGLGQEVLLVWV